MLAFADYPYTSNDLEVVSIRRSVFDVMKVKFPAAIAEVSHPFPSRTRPLSPPAPMVLRGRHVGE